MLSIRIKILLLSLLLVLYSRVIAQSNIDSLEQIVSSSTYSWEEQIEAIEILLAEFRHKEPSKHLAYAQLLLQYGIDEGVDTMQAKAYFEIGKYYYKQSETDSCLSYYEQAELLFAENNHLFGLKSILVGQSNLQKKLGNYNKAIQFLLQADSINQISFDEKAAVSILNNLGIIAQHQKDYPSAIRYYKNMINLNPAEKFIAVASSNLSGVYMLSNEQDSAMHYALMSLEIRERLEISSGLTQLYNNLGAIYQEKGELKNAEKWFAKSLADARLNNDKSVQIIALNNMGKLGVLQGNYSQAEQALMEGQELLNDFENLKAEMYNAKYFNQVYQATNQIDKAYKYLSIYSNLKDSIAKIENNALTEEFQIKYDTEKYKQEKAIANVNEEVAHRKAKTSKLVSYGALIVSLLIAALLFYIFTRLKLIRKQKKELDNAYALLEESKKNELAVSNLKALQSQMNPHFIFNALNSVQDLVLLQDIRNSNKYLGKFSDLIRKILLSSKEQFISLAEEVEILSLYLDLEKLRFGEDFQIDLKCEVDADKQDEIVLPAMFIQPYIENAIKHGLFHKEGLKKLKVHFSLLDQNTLECIVEDNGIGQEQAEIYKKKRLHLHTGFSTEAINERIRLLNETLEKKIDLEIADLTEGDKPIGTRIILHFPIQEAK